MEGLEEWEVLPEDGFLQIHDDDDADDGKKIFSRKFAKAENVFNNYFICPSPPKSSQFVETTTTTTSPNYNQLVPVPIIHLPEPAAAAIKNQIPQKDSDQGLKQLIVAPPPVHDIITAAADQDPAVSQVFFKKIKKDTYTSPELFVDMKLDSPKSNNNSNPSPRMKLTDHPDQGTSKKIMINKNNHHKNNMEIDGGSTDDENIEKEVNGLNNIVKWSLTGIGAICSFGVATVCILIFGGGLGKNNKRQEQQQQQQNQNQNQNHRKLQFHIYTSEDKTLKKVVHHATKWNEAMSAVRRGVHPAAVPISRAHITVGGYYDGF